MAGIDPVLSVPTRHGDVEMLFVDFKHMVNQHNLGKHLASVFDVHDAIRQPDIIRQSDRNPDCALYIKKRATYVGKDWFTATVVNFKRMRIDTGYNTMGTGNLKGPIIGPQPEDLI